MSDTRVTGDPQFWPTPEQAYAHAPRLMREIGWTMRPARATGPFTDPTRRDCLRKAALFDRIALIDDPDCQSDASQVAHDTARFLVDLDDAHVNGDPRAYVRQQYALTHTADHR